MGPAHMATPWPPQTRHPLQSGGGSGCSRITSTYRATASGRSIQGLHPSQVLIQRGVRPRLSPCPGIRVPNRDHRYGQRSCIHLSQHPRHLFPFGTSIGGFPATVFLSRLITVRVGAWNSQENPPRRTHFSLRYGATSKACGNSGAKQYLAFFPDFAGVAGSS
jgi:hypothetical protein